MLSLGLVLHACSSIPRSSQSEIINPTLTLSPCTARADFGDPAESFYILPYPVGKSYRISQSYCYPDGGHSFQLAYDFDMPIGLDIIADRSGRVIEVKEDIPDICDWEYLGPHNYVLIKHDDSSAAFYAHLKQEGILVEVGEYVEQGQLIAESGNSGFTGYRSHLHFGVYRYYPLREGHDVPVNFFNADGPLDSRGGLIQWRFYEALPY